MAVSIKVVRDEGPMVIMLRSSGHAPCALLGYMVLQDIHRSQNGALEIQEVSVSC